MELFYRKYGQGPSLIIVHGLYGSSDNWTGIARALGKYFEVYVVDQRNHGRSPHSPKHNYELMKNDLYEFVERHSIGKAIFLGHSMGGKSVMFFAAAHPEKVNGLIVVDIAPKSYKLTAKAMKKTIDHETILRSMAKVDFSSVQSRGEVDKALAIDIGLERVRLFLMKNLERDGQKGFRWKINVETLIKCLDSILSGMNEKDFEKGGEITGFPVLFIKGANSDYILDSDLPLIKTIFPYSEFAVIPKTGHWLHVEQPELLVESILEFMLD